ncbi:MAG: dienelactone hydrolase family protein [Gemmatimonadaceae bacterium]
MTPSTYTRSADVAERTVVVDAGGVALEGDLAVPSGARGLVMFAHGSGSSRHSSRNRYVAEELRQRELGTLLLDLLTPDEERVDRRTRHIRFDIGLLADRLIGALSWLATQDDTCALPVGLFGASTGSGAALVAAARMPDHVDAVVSRGGRPDLAAEELPHVRAPTLLLVGNHDAVVIELNKHAMRHMKAPVRLEVVPGATHLFEEPGTLEQVAGLAREWFVHYLAMDATERSSE